MRTDLVVVGGANMDYTVRGARLPGPGETVEGDQFLQAPGGKGANQAVAAARLGARVAFVGRVGDDEPGARVLAALEREGVDTAGVYRDPGSSTGVALILVGEGGEKQIMVAPGANRLMEPADVAAAEALTGARVALLQLEIPLEAVLEAARCARHGGARVVLDPAPAVPLPDDLLRLLDVIRPNASEAEVLTGIPVRDRDSAREAARALRRRGVAAAVVQAGDQGNLLVHAGGELFLPRVPVRSVDATGAGDAFAAALAVRLGEGAELEEAAVFGSAAAALATTVVGAQAGLPTREEVLALLARHPAASGIRG